MQNADIKANTLLKKVDNLSKIYNNIFEFEFKNKKTYIRRGKMIKSVSVNSEFLDHIKKSKLVVIRERKNFFDDNGKKQDEAVNMVFHCMALDPEISGIIFSVKTKITDIKVGDIVRGNIEKANVYALTTRDVPKNTMVPIRVSLRGQLTKVANDQ